MKTFNLSGQVTVSIYTEVEAETLEEAIRISGHRDIEAYEWGNETKKKHVWVSDEYDGLPEEITG